MEDGFGFTKMWWSYDLCLKPYLHWHSSWVVLFWWAHGKGQLLDIVSKIKSHLYSIFLNCWGLKKKFCQRYTHAYNASSGHLINVEKFTFYRNSTISKIVFMILVGKRWHTKWVKTKTDFASSCVYSI